MHFSNTSALLALDMDTMRSRLVSRKLIFLKHLLEDNAAGVGAVAMRSFVDDVDSLCLVKECRELENHFGTNFTDAVLLDGNTVSQRTIKKTIRGIDKEQLIRKCSGTSPCVADITIEGGSWPKLWDTALHLGSRHTIGLRNLARLMAHHGRGLHPCPLCDEHDLPMSVIEHVICNHHRDLGLNFSSTDCLLTRLEESNIQFVYKFWKLYTIS